MFLKKLFRKDYRFYLQQGDKYLAEDRYADARIAFSEALHRLPATGGEVDAEHALVCKRLREVGDKLGWLNLAEAEHAVARGDKTRASDHLALTLELADDVTIREKAEKLLHSLTDATALSTPVREGSHGCSVCASGKDNAAENNHLFDETLSTADRFDILIQPLPGDLAHRYAELGEEFAYAYVARHDGNDAESLRIYKKLLAQDENDIILYETALIHYRSEDLQECERLLRRATDLNPHNPLCYLSLVQLFIDTERFSEALQTLEYMVNEKLLQEQALLMAGEVFQHVGDQERAMEKFTQALVFPHAARAAAERLIPLLEQQGRTAEAQYLFKQHCKGCC